MLEFLSWIWSQAEKVYYWFGSNFYFLLNFLFSVPGLIVSIANSLIQSALASLRGLLDYIYSLALSAYNIAIGYGTAIFTYINQRIEAALNTLNGVKQSIIDYVTALIATIRDGLSSLIVNVRDGLSIIISNGLAQVRDWVTSSFAWVLNLRDRIVNLLTLLTPQRINALLSFLTTWLQTIVLFFSNPVVFIFDILQAKIISYLCYVIAWSLGTTKYDLPKTQTWKE